MSDALKRSPAKKIKPTATGICTIISIDLREGSIFLDYTINRITSSGKKLFSVVVVLRIFGIIFFRYRCHNTRVSSSEPAPFPEYVPPVGLPAYVLSYFLARYCTTDCHTCGLDFATFSAITGVRGAAGGRQPAAARTPCMYNNNIHRPPEP